MSDNDVVLGTGAKDEYDTPEEAASARRMQGLPDEDQDQDSTPAPPAPPAPPVTPPAAPGGGSLPTDAGTPAP